jgi:replicative DNA helicase
MKNPVATVAETESIEFVINSIAQADYLSPDVSKDAIEGLWLQSVGHNIATLGLKMSEGDHSAMGELQTLIDRHKDSYMPDEFGEVCSDDLVELAKFDSNENKFKFNINSLSKRVYGLGRSDFSVIFAYVNVGKTAMDVSLTCAPNGFIDQGAKVMVLGNEEAIRKTFNRAVGASTGFTRDQIDANRPHATDLFRKHKQNRLHFMDTPDWTMDKVDSFLKHRKDRYGLDIVIIDQLDKVQIPGNFNGTHEKLRELYRRMRESAKRYEIAVIAVSQASAEAKGRTRIDLGMMENSKVGKGAEADLIIGISSKDLDNEDEGSQMRFLSVAKNKLSGWHGVIPVTLQAEINRYGD